MQLGFTGGLADWNIAERGGSEEGRGTVTQGSAILREGDSFLVTLDQSFRIPEAPLTVEFTYEASFDTTDARFVNDAFEAALVDTDGFSLVDTFQSDRDAYFNLTEQMPAAMGQGTTEQSQTSSSHVSLDIRDVPPGTDANLIFRLVNNDADQETTVRILDVQVTSDLDNSCSIGGYVYLDVNNNGVKDAPELPLPNVTITLAGAVDAITTTNVDGWYEFTELPPGEYSIHETQPSAFIDGKETPGNPLLGQVADNLFHGMQVTSQMAALHYNFGEMGLIPQLVSKQFFLASTPDGQQLLSTVVAENGEGWFSFSSDTEGEFIVSLNESIEGLTVELYTDDMIPVALSDGESQMVAPVAEGESYVLHIAGDTDGGALAAVLAIRPRARSSHRRTTRST